MHSLMPSAQLGPFYTKLPVAFAPVLRALEGGTQTLPISFARESLFICITPTRSSTHTPQPS